MDTLEPYVRFAIEAYIWLWGAMFVVLFVGVAGLILAKLNKRDHL